MARCVEVIAEGDLGRAAATFGVCLHVLRKDLLLMSIAMDLEPMSTLMSTAKKLKPLKPVRRWIIRKDNGSAQRTVHSWGASCKSPVLAWVVSQLLEESYLPMALC